VLSPATVRLVAQGMPPLLWKRYAGSLPQCWRGSDTPRHGAPRSCRPARPTSPTTWRNRRKGPAHNRKSSCGPAGVRHCAPSTRSGSWLVSSSKVEEVRASVRRTRCVHRGQATPVLTHEVLCALALHSPPRDGGRPRSCPLFAEKRDIELTVRASALMRGAGLCRRHSDCLQEAQLGDAIVLHQLVDITIFGSKTDPTPAGQASTLPMSERANAGHPLSWRAPAWASRAARLIALPLDTLATVIARFRASCPERAVGRGAAEFTNWAADIQALAVDGSTVTVHCLPIYGIWLFTRLDSDSDLSEAVPLSPFMSRSRAVLSSIGLTIARQGSHSFRGGRAGEMYHGGASEPAAGGSRDAQASERRVHSTVHN
jgi:hypothetical protein